jgi:4-hydroxy-2-oxoheptanedioate aldolase
MEHNALDFMQLREFMRGLKDGGPTRSGHVTPAVFVETCIIALDEAYMRANSWVIEQLLDCGIHGIHMCHARDTGAVRVATQMACRFPFDRPGVPKLPLQGLRGSSPGYAAQMWGMPLNKYLHLADLWPLNPRGEIIFGIKIEDTYCDRTVAETMKLPGIAMAEWGPGDHSYWLYGLEAYPEDGPAVRNLEDRPEMMAVRQQVLDLCKQHKVMFLNAGNNNPDSSTYTIKQIREGAMVIESDEASAVAGREFSKRKMPV